MIPWHKWFRITGAERIALVEASLWLPVSLLAIHLLSFRWIAKTLGETSLHSPENLSPEQARRADRVGWAVRTMARYLPGDWSCLARAIAVKRMLRRRRIPSTLYLGVAKDDVEGFRAHAWVRCGAEILTGGGNHGEYTVVSTFGER